MPDIPGTHDNAAMGAIDLDVTAEQTPPLAHPPKRSGRQLEMIQCSVCATWFHTDCVGIKKKTPRSEYGRARRVGLSQTKSSIVNGAVNVVKSGRPATRQRRSTTIEQHDGRQYPHRNAADKSTYRQRPEGHLDHHHNERHIATANVENDDRYEQHGDHGRRAGALQRPHQQRQNGTDRHPAATHRHPGGASGRLSGQCAKCGEMNHTTAQCKHHHEVQCRQCGEYGHKDKHHGHGE